LRLIDMLVVAKDEDGNDPAPGHRRDERGNFWRSPASIIPLDGRPSRENRSGRWLSRFEAADAWAI